MLVQRIQRLGILKVYLDRAQPKIGPCPKAPKIAPDTCGQCQKVPAKWLLTVGNDFTNNGCTDCASLNAGQWELTYTGNCIWNSPWFPSICGAQVQWSVYIDGAGWRLFLQTAITSRLRYDPIGLATFNCLKANTFIHPSWDSATCQSASSATITPMP